MARDNATSTASVAVIAEDQAPPPNQSATPQERAALERFRARRDRRTPAPRFKAEYQGNTVTITGDHKDETYSHLLLADMLATGDTAFSGGLLDQIANFARSGEQLTTRELNFVLSIVRAIDPRDPTEALLAVQMAAIHNATVAAARGLTHSDNIPQQDSASNMLNKLARTFATQVEALKRYRSTGEQSIKVQHVTVADGGQAVIGNVHAGGGVPQRTGGQPHELGATAPTSPADAQRPPMLGHEQAHGMPVPSASGQRLERVPVPRRAGRGAEGAA